MGGLPHVLTGYQPVADPQVRERFAQAWGRALPERPGMTITDMVAAMIEAPARLRSTVPPGTLFLPIHFGENPTNVLTNAEVFDLAVKIPEFKVSKVKLAKLQE